MNIHTMKDRKYMKIQGFNMKKIMKSGKRKANSWC